MTVDRQQDAPGGRSVLRQHALRARRVIVIGFGPVAARLVDELRPAVADRRVSIVVVGAERHPAYNRIMIGEFALGRTDHELLPLSDPAELSADGITVRLGVPVTGIDRERKYVTLADGEQQAYDLLVFATGAAANVPPLPGLPRGRAGEDPALPDGIAVLRDLDDSARISRLTATGESLVVLGGGVLGMELALAASEAGLPTTLVHTGRVPMERNLDPTSAALVSQQLRSREITVIADGKAEAVRLTGGRFQSLQLADGRRIGGAALVLCCGATARTRLGEGCGLATGSGILVDHQLRSVTDGSMYAIGDCARIRCGETDCERCAGSPAPSGLIAPGWAQAEWLASHLLAGLTPVGSEAPAESRPVMILKSAGLSVVSAGRIDLEPIDSLIDDAARHRVAQWSDPGQGRYAKMITRDGVLEGMICVGLPRTAAELTLLYQRRAELPSDRSALLRHDGPDHAVGADPLTDDATVCRCNGVSAGQISTAIDEGHDDVAAIGRATRAGTGCGTCTDRICELLAARPEGALT